jgi:membrane associated rhomboid family serine protease
MGLADRHYMRDEYHPPNITIKLIVVLLVAFVIQSVLLFYGDINLIEDLALSVQGLSHGKIWQLLTFQFLHAAPWPWHVLFNCLALFFFGRSVEETLGPKKFLSLYFLSGLAGGLLHVIMTVVLPRHEDIPVVGASAGICGIIAIFCALNPMRELTTWIYFFPITIRARYFLMFLSLFSAFGTLIPFGNTAYAAHLGGILTGLAYVRWRDKWERLFQRWRRSSGQRREEELVNAARVRGRPWREGTTETPPEDFMAKEVDPILDKISTHGIHSLTERERKILDAARKKIRKH